MLLFAGDSLPCIIGLTTSCAAYGYWAYLNNNPL